MKLIEDGKPPIDQYKFHPIYTVSTPGVAGAWITVISSVNDVLVGPLTFHHTGGNGTVTARVTLDGTALTGTAIYAHHQLIYFTLDDASDTISGSTTIAGFGGAVDCYARSLKFECSTDQNGGTVDTSGRIYPK